MNDNKMDIKVTFKCDRDMKNYLDKETLKKKGTVSDCVRGIIYNQMHSRNSNMMERLCRLTTLCNDLIYKGNLDEKTKQALMEEVANLWLDL